MRSVESKSKVLRAALVFAVLSVLLPSAAAGGELIVNGSFDTGAFGPAWVHGAYRGGNTNPGLADHVVVPDLPFSGNYSALVGFKYATQTTNAYGYIYQQVTIPANISGATLYFKMRQQGYDSTPYDPFRAQIRNSSGGLLQTIVTHTFPEYNYQFKDSGWLDDDDAPPVGVDMSAYAGQTIRVYFEQGSTIDALYETWAFVDDVSLVYSMWVDLAVEGNGDDLFGAAGTGAGALGVASGVAGDTLTYDVVVENEGNVADTYTLSLTNPIGATMWIDDGGGPQAFPYVTATIPAGGTVTYQVSVVIPGGASAGSYDFVLDAVSTTSGTRVDSGTLRAIVTPAIHGTDLAVDGNGFGVIGGNGTGGFALKQAPWDSTVTYNLEVVNTGNAPTTFRMVMSPDAGAVTSIWVGPTQYTSMFTTPAVPSGGSLAMTLEVEVPSFNPGGDYATIIQATAWDDTLKKDSVKAVLRLRAPRFDMVIGTNGDGIYDATGSGLGGSSTTSGERSTSVYFPVLIQNESSIIDSFDLDWNGPVGWTAAIEVGGVPQVFPFTTAAIAGFGQAEYLLRIDVPAGAAFATFASVLFGTSMVSNQILESVSANVSVSDASEGVDMAIDGQGSGVYGPKFTGLGGSSTQTAAPGDTLYFTIDLVNLAGPNAIDIAWNTPSGWTVTFDALPSPIAGHPEGTYQLMVVVPAASTGGTFDIIIDAEKADEPFYNDSVTGRVIVTPPLSVDAIIDGNGDDIYGAPGTGLGGVSAQTHSAPVTLSYTIEIENESAVADQYTITWNSIPGWIATLNASPSPFVTASIPAGGFAILSFSVTVPGSPPSGAYSYFVDVVSNTDGGVTESVEARINIVSPPRADFVIDGDGAGVFGNLGSGDGGTSTVAAAPGAFYTSTLELRNVGSFADSFFVDWSEPAGWPAGSVVVDDAGVNHTSGFWTGVIAAGAGLTFTLEVQVPPGAGTGFFEAIFDAYSSLPPNAPESARLVTQTAGLVTGIVFEDRDHDGVFGAGDAGLPGVQVRETNSGQSALTDGAGRYRFQITSGASAIVIEANPSGFISLTPDTVATAIVTAGDTVTVDFADVMPLRITTGSILSAVAGGFVDFPHRLDAATTGQVTLTATVDPGVTTMFMLDQNGNGVFDGTDRALQPGDIDMDPPGGLSTVHILVRVFVPATMTVGTTSRIIVDASQVIGATTQVTTAQAIDAVVVVQNTVGRVDLQKQVDLAAAAPGDVLTYTITFFNSGADSLQNVVVLDPVSQFVDPVPDAFGPGQDVEWQRQGAPVVYLTLALDADECEYDAAGRLLRLLFSKNTPYYLEPGETGTLTYRVQVR